MSHRELKLPRTNGDEIRVQVGDGGVLIRHFVRTRGRMAGGWLEMPALVTLDAETARAVAQFILDTPSTKEQREVVAHSMHCTNCDVLGDMVLQDDTGFLCEPCTDQFDAASEDGPDVIVEWAVDNCAVCYTGSATRCARHGEPR